MRIGRLDGAPHALALPILAALRGRASAQVLLARPPPGCRDRMPGFSHYTGSQPLVFRQ
jgi:hypothetical protein